MLGDSLKNALSLSKIIRIRKIPVVFGGIFPSVLPNVVLSNPHVDFVIRNDGVKAFARLLGVLERREKISDVEGLSYKKEKQIINNPTKRTSKLSYVKLPLHLLDLDDYNINIMNIESSRGCPNSCSFCYNKRYNNCKWRPLKYKDVVKMIRDFVENTNVKTINFCDDDFLVDIKRAKKIIKSIHREYPWINSSASTSFNTVKKMSRKGLEELRTNNFERLSMGIESGSGRISSLLNKKIDYESLLELNKTLFQYKIHVCYNFMIGYPSETLDDLRKTTKLAYELVSQNKRAIVGRFAIFHPLPFTDSVFFAKKYGYREEKELRDYTTITLDVLSKGWWKTKPWIDKKRARLLECIQMSGIGLRVRKGASISSEVHRVFVRGYKKFARFRFKHFIFYFNFEKYLKNYAIRLTQKRMEQIY